MTITSEMPGQLEEPPAKHRPRGRLDSLTEMPTHLIALSPAFLEALRRVAPKVRPRRLPYVLTLATFVAIGIVSGQRILVNHNAAAGAPAPLAASAATGPTTVDSVAPSPTTLRPDVASTNASDSATAFGPTAPPTTISVDKLPRTTTPKATKNRHLQAPR